MKIHLCAGDCFLTNYINCDIDGKIVELCDRNKMALRALSNYYKDRMVGNKHTTRVDLKFNVLRFPWPWENGSVDELVMIQAIEHFTLQEAGFIVSEVKRVLKTGGKFLVDFPDIETTVKQYINHNPNFCMRFIYCNHKNKYSIHHWGYTRETFAELLGDGWQLNFRNIVEHDYPVIGCEAIKL